MVPASGDGRVKRLAMSCAVARAVEAAESMMWSGWVELGEGAADGGFEQGIVSAAEQERLRAGRGGESFGEVDAEYLAGDGVVDPALFDERDE